MEQNKFNRLLNNTILFIIGNKKNCGKTTFLNLVLHQVRSKYVPIFTSIGVDGEQQDQISKNSKPQCIVECGDIVITTDKMLHKSQATFKVLEVFDVSNALGNLVLAKALRSGTIELVGPENNTHFNRIINHVLQTVDIKRHKIIIDGAINRLTQVVNYGDRVTSLAYVATINPSNVDKSINDIKRMYQLNTIKRYDQSEIHKPFLTIEGALTSNKLKGINNKVTCLVVEDFTKIFLSYRELNYLLSEKELLFQNTYKLLFFILNLFDIEEDSLINKLDNKIKDFIFLNPYKDYSLNKS